MSAPVTRHQRHRVNLTLDAELVDTARQMKLNLSRAAENGLERAIAAARAEEWKKENAAAIAAYNARIEREGPLLMPYWVEED